MFCNLGKVCSVGGLSGCPASTFTTRCEAVYCEDSRVSQGDNFYLTDASCYLSQTDLWVLIWPVSIFQSLCDDKPISIPLLSPPLLRSEIVQFTYVPHFLTGPPHFLTFHNISPIVYLSPQQQLAHQRIAVNPDPGRESASTSL